MDAGSPKCFRFPDQRTTASVLRHGGASGFSYTFLYCCIWAVDEVKGINSTHSRNLMVSSQ